MKIFNYTKLLKDYNTLKLEKESLEDLIKSNIYKKLISEHNAELMCKSLKEENKRLRETIKNLRERIKK